MYSIMGGLLSNMGRVLRTYNIEQRVYKSLSEERKVVPPKHKSTIPIIKEIQTEYADKYDELLRKNETLDKNLKSVYVKSVNEPPQNLPRDLDLLPKRTRYESPFEYGYSDPKAVSHGRYTLTQIIEILTAHYSNREENTAEVLAKQYNLDPEHLRSIFKYYKLFKLARRPDKRKTITAQQWTKKQDIGLRNIKKISSGNNKKTEET